MLKSDPLEKEIERKLVYHCKARGLLCYKFSSPAHAGVPDRVIIGYGKVLFLEVKRAGQSPTALQLRELTRINLAAGKTGNFEANWCDSVEQGELIIDQFFLPI
jgi:hypothetical protein